MIVYADKGFETRSDMPNTDWTGNAMYVVPDGSELALKIEGLYPYYEFVVENGVLVDVLPTERPTPEPKVTLEERVTDLEDAIAAVYGGAV